LSDGNGTLTAAGGGVLEEARVTGRSAA